MKCPSCTNFVMEGADKCSCGYEIVKQVRNALCERCNRRRGRKIVTQKATEYRQEKYTMICFECHYKTNEQKPATFKTIEEKRYAEEQARYARAEFYGDKPDEKALAIAGWEMTKARYKKDEPIPEVVAVEEPTTPAEPAEPENEDIIILDDEIDFNLFE